LPKRTIGATGKKQKGVPSSFTGSGPSSCCRNKGQNRKESNKSQKKETLVKRQYLSSGNFIFGVDLLQHRTQSFSKNVSFSHRPPPPKIDNRGSEGEIGGDGQEKV
jgi:hypothetical protein